MSFGNCRGGLASHLFYKRCCLAALSVCHCSLCMLVVQANMSTALTVFRKYDACSRGAVEVIRNLYIRRNMVDHCWEICSESVPRHREPHQSR